MVSATSVAKPPPAPRDGPPETAIREVTDVYFGASVTDPYRWLENQEDPEVKAWMQAQGGYTRRKLDALPVHRELQDRITSLNQSTIDVATAQEAGGQLFYTKVPEGKDHLCLFVRPATGGAPERLLVDTGALSTATQAATIDFFFPSRGGTYVAYGASLAGSEDTVVRIVETATGKLLPESMDRTNFTYVSWLDERRFLYVRLPPLAKGAPESDKYKWSRVYLHVLGTSPEKDQAIFGSGLIPEIAIPDDDFSDAVTFAGSDHVLIRTGPGTAKEFSVYTARISDLSGPKTKWTKLYSGEEHAVTDLVAVGDDLFVLTHRDAPRFRVLKTSLKKPDLATAEVMIPESDVILRGLALGKDAVYVRGLSAGTGRLYAVPLGKAPKTSNTKRATYEEIALPAPGPIRLFFADSSAPGVVFQQRSWTAPASWARVDLASKKAVDLGLVPPSPADFSAVAETHEWATSADGTKIPMTLLHRRDLARDGKNPAWLEGYGAYGYANEPWFDPTRLAWFERGGVLAVCHIRGGGELGESWHQAGSRANKHKGVADYVACAERLISLGLTSKEHLGAAGASAGGLIIGKVISERPELFAAALIEVGLADTLRMELEVSGPLNVVEFGTVKVKEQFEWLRAQSPYAAVRDGLKYPAVLLTAGMRDARVSPWQPAKMAARLQKATSSDKPVLLRIDPEGGHFSQRVSKAQYSRDVADMTAFMWTYTH